MRPNLISEDYSNLAPLLRATIAADRFPLSPLKPPGEPSMVVARMRDRKRRR
jgi:hypothetical protein